MILVDSNILIDLFVQPSDHHGKTRLAVIYPLMRKIEAGEVEAYVPEVVLHECFYVLVLRLRIIEPVEYCRAFASILRFPGWMMSSQELSVYMRAIDILENRPSLRFSDAVIAARAEAYGAELATFDQRLLAIYDGPRWQSTADAE